MMGDGSYQISSVRSFDVPNRHNPITHVNVWDDGIIIFKTRAPRLRLLRVASSTDPG